MLVDGSSGRVPAVLFRFPRLGIAPRLPIVLRLQLGPCFQLGPRPRIARPPTGDEARDRSAAELIQRLAQYLTVDFAQRNGAVAEDREELHLLALVLLEGRGRARVPDLRAEELG